MAADPRVADRLSRGRFLLDEMLSPAIAVQLRDRGWDAEAVVENPAWRRLPGAEVLALATELDRSLVTSNIRDFAPLDRAWKAAGRAHRGLILLPSTSFPQNAGFMGAVVSALDAAAVGDTLPAKDGVTFLTRG